MCNFAVQTEKLVCFISNLCALYNLKDGTN